MMVAAQSKVKKKREEKKSSSARVSVLGYRVDLVSMTPITFAIYAIERKRKKSIERGGKKRKIQKRSSKEQQYLRNPESKKDSYQSKHLRQYNSLKLR